MKMVRLKVLDEHAEYLTKQFYRLKYKVEPVNKDIVEIFEANPGISLTKFQTTLRNKGIQRRKSLLKNIADRCGYTYSD